MRVGRRCQQRGFTLLEVAVATTVFSMGLGSFSLLLLLALQGTTESRYQSMAVVRATSMAEMVLMNPDAVGHFVNPVPVSSGSCEADEMCEPGIMAGSDLQGWQTALEQALPGGSGLVCLDSTPNDGTIDNAGCDGTGSPVVKVFWEETRAHDDSAVQSRIVTRIPLP